MKQSHPSVILMNFTGVYDYEAFARRRGMVHLDCTHLRGTECYCDAGGAAALRRLIAPYPPEGIHFIDSGDFHYLTKFWTDKLTRPFSLLVFDHHPDLQQPRYGGVLSCGGWVADVVRENPWVRQVCLVGVDRRLVAEVPAELRPRVHFFCGDEGGYEAACRNFSAGWLQGPVYLSIDKDVLSPREVRTNWDQGTMSLVAMEDVLRRVLERTPLLGVDICGECAATLDCFEEQREADGNSRVNSELLDLLLRAAGGPGLGAHCK